MKNSSSQTKSTKPQRKHSSEANWKPVRKGAIFCSPACGGGCTRADYLRAVQGAKQMRNQLRGHGWQVVTVEGDSWNVKAASGPLTILSDYRGKGGKVRYACSMGGNLPGYVTFDEPNEAVEYTVNHCIAGADMGLGMLFDACSVSGLKSSFFRVFSQHRAVEFLRHPGTLSKADAALSSMVLDPKRKTKKSLTT
jgi:hypothetical protein